MYRTPHPFPGLPMCYWNHFLLVDIVVNASQRYSILQEFAGSYAGKQYERGSGSSRSRDMQCLTSRFACRGCLNHVAFYPLRFDIIVLSTSRDCGRFSLASCMHRDRLCPFASSVSSWYEHHILYCKPSPFLHHLGNSRVMVLVD